MSAVRFRDSDRTSRFPLRVLPSLCIAALLQVATGAQAQDAPAASPTQLDTVIVTGEQRAPYTVEETGAATKLPLSLRETPQSVTVITRERIEDQNLQSLRDVLDNVTGISSYAYDTERVVFTSRGFIIDNTLYDGVPVAPALNTSSSEATLDTAVYERIEVVRGATGLMSGAGNPSAAINLVRKRADSKTYTGSLGYSAGSWNDRRGEFDLSTPLDENGSVRARVVGVYQESDSNLDLYHRRKKVLFGTVDADLGASTLLTLGYEYQESLPDSNTWGSFPLFFSDGSRTDWPRSVNTSTDWAYWNNKTQTTFANLQHDFGGGWLLRANFTHRALDSDSALFYVEGFIDKETGEGLTPYVYFADDHAQQNAVDLYLSGAFEGFGRKHELVVGFNGSRMTDDAFSREPADESLPPVGNFYEWTGSYPEPVLSDSANRDTGIATDQTGLYVALRFSLADPLKLIAGARYSTWKGEGESFGTPNDADHEVTTPYAGLIYDLGKSYSAFASYTEIFTPQSFQYEDGGYLDPITGKSQEIGIKGEHFGGRLNTALTLFDTRQDNVGIAVPGGFVKDGEGNATLIPAYEAVDGTKTRGFELEVAGEPIPGWNASLGWSHYTMQDADSETVKAYLPRTLVRLFNSWTPSGAWSGLTVGGGINWQSSTWLDVLSSYEPEDNTTRVDQSAVTLVSLLLRYRFTPQLSVQLNADNLLDEKYYVLDEYGNLYYGEPRSATLGFSYSF